MSDYTYFDKFENSDFAKGILKLVCKENGVALGFECLKCKVTLLPYLKVNSAMGYKEQVIEVNCIFHN